MNWNASLVSIVTFHMQVWWSLICKGSTHVSVLKRKLRGIEIWDPHFILLCIAKAFAQFWCSCLMKYRKSGLIIPSIFHSHLLNTVLQDVHPGWCNTIHLTACFWLGRANPTFSEGGVSPTSSEDNDSHTLSIFLLKIIALSCYWYMEGWAFIYSSHRHTELNLTAQLGTYYSMCSMQRCAITCACNTWTWFTAYFTYTVSYVVDLFCMLFSSCMYYLLCGCMDLPVRAVRVALGGALGFTGGRRSPPLHSQVELLSPKQETGYWESRKRRRKESVRQPRKISLRIILLFKNKSNSHESLREGPRQQRQVSGWVSGWCRILSAAAASATWKTARNREGSERAWNAEQEITCH